MNQQQAADESKLDDNGSTYNLGLMTCRTLPGSQAREYIIQSSSSLFNLIDLFVWIIFLFLLISSFYGYFLGMMMIWLFLKRRMVREESILAIRDVGIQVKTTYWGGSSVSRFINRLKIEDIIINEGISFWQIRSYLAILVKDENKMVVVFQNLLPTLDPMLIRVYQGTRAMIFTHNDDNERL